MASILVTVLCVTLVTTVSAQTGTGTASTSSASGAAAPPPISNAPELGVPCAKPTDCGGALPALCEFCPATTASAVASSGCAHHECINGWCQTIMCGGCGSACDDVCWCPVSSSGFIQTGPGLCKCAECNCASECHGPLPDLCLVCPNGGDGCAHWTCVNHQCTIAYCPS